MLSDTLPIATKNPIASWVVSPEIYPKGQLHPTNAPEVCNRLSWRVLVQTAAVQLRAYEREHDEKEKAQWQKRITQTIQEANSLNSSGLWGYRDAPIHPMPDYPVLNVTGIWLEALTRKLTATFGNAIPAIILNN